MLTQQIATLIERIAQAGQPPMHTLTAQAARAFYEKAGTILAGAVFSRRRLHHWQPRNARRALPTACRTGQLCSAVSRLPLSPGTSISRSRP